MHQRSSLLVLVALGLSCLPMAARAAVVVTSDSSAPTSYFANSTVSAGGLQWRWDDVNGRRDVGQSFYTGTAALTLDKITFQIVSNSTPGAGAANAPFTLNVYQVSSASAFPTAGTAILTETGSLSAVHATSADLGKYITFDMTNTALSASSYYAVILSFDSQAVARNMVWQVSNTPASYPNGQCIISTNGTTFSANNDLVFYASAIPEPRGGFLTLAGLGSVFIAFRLRKRFSR